MSTLSTYIEACCSRRHGQLYQYSRIIGLATPYKMLTRAEAEIFAKMPRFRHRDALYLIGRVLLIFAATRRWADCFYLATTAA